MGLTGFMGFIDQGLGLNTVLEGVEFRVHIIELIGRIGFIV